MSRGPVLTLVAVVVLGLVLWGADAALQPSRPNPAVAGGPAVPAAPPAAVTFVGYATTEQGQIPVAVTVDKGKTKMYVCDGRQTEAWMQGNASSTGTTSPNVTSPSTTSPSTTSPSASRTSDGNPSGRSSSGDIDAGGRNGNHATAHFSSGHLTGSMHVDGHKDWSFDASTTSDGHAGIYRRRAKGKTSGWAVLGKNDQRGLTRSSDGALAPAPPLPLDGEPLPDGVSRVDGDTDVLSDP